MAFILYALTFAALRSILLVNGQTTHNVTVGLKGSFYDPPTLSVGLNDTVQFIFAGFLNSVTQSTFDNPCLPLPGGFSSGAVGTRGDPNALIKTWNLQVTNISAPIWYFCEITTPSSHCGAGMVGAINPPNITVYESWTALAKAVSGTPSPSVAPALTGIGAFATQTAAPPPIPITFSTTSSSNAKVHLGAIAGGAVGGAVLIAVLIGVILWFFRQKRSKAFPLSPDSDDSNFFRYNPVPVRRPSQAFMEAKQLESASSAALSHMTSSRLVSPDSALMPNRPGLNSLSSGVPRARVSEANQTNPQPTQLPRMGIERQASFGTSLDRQTSFATTNITTSHGLSEQPSSINIHALANEVATLLRTPSGNILGPTAPNPEGPRPRNKHQEGRNGDHPVNRTESPMGPPAYRTTIGTPDRTSG